MVSPLLVGALSKQHQGIGNLTGCALALEISALKQQLNRPLVVLCADSGEASRLKQDLKFLCPKEKILAFRDYETLPYDQLSPHQAIISSRLEFLSLSPSLSDGILISSLHAIMQRLCPQDYITANSFVLSRGDKRDLASLRDNFATYGYTRVDQVYEHGEFAVRGSILDIFPMGSKQPLRIDFFDDEVDSISYFDVQTQRSIEKIDSIQLLPAHEFPLDKDSVALFRSRYREVFVNGHLPNHPIYQAVSRNAIPSGVQYYLPLFFNKSATFFDYLSQDAALVLVGNFEDSARAYYQQIHERAQMFIGNSDHPPLPPELLFISPEQIFEELNQRECIFLQEDSLNTVQIRTSHASRTKQNNKKQESDSDHTKSKAQRRTSPAKLNIMYDNAPCLAVPNIAFDHHDKVSGTNLINFIREFCLKRNGRILISAISEGRRQSLRDLIPSAIANDPALGIQAASSMEDFLNSEAPIMMTISPFDQGVIFANAPFKNLTATSQKASADESKVLANTDDSDSSDTSSSSNQATNTKGKRKSKHTDITTEEGFEERPIDWSSIPYTGTIQCASEHPIAFLTETELLGFKVMRQRKRNSRAQKLEQDTIIRNLAQLEEGEIVVHLDHGIGRYCGLKTVVINDIPMELLVIEYQNGDKLSIPITALNKVARYAGEDNPQLSRLGNDTWQKKRQQAAQKVRDVAAELLDIYAQRELKRGFAFQVDEHALEEFVSNFPYEETDDQLRAIHDTLADMQKPIAMDRLVCGDVGFGKTEVALRAAFVAAMNGKQVAVLSPTTILAEQHYENFKERFATTAINVDMLSRFKTKQEQNKTLALLKEGAIDIIIGTHRLLSSQLKFKDLGLLIIDEEHRFGVRQKEKLKELRAEVDLLTLTATPIPRTLNMALEGMRELSIIATPPENRLSVKTFVRENSQSLCREAIMRELRRGGQVYYLHNDVATMALKADELSRIVPEAKIEIAHGQMNEQELRRVMQDFHHQRFNVLLCSTIIENGLDIPSANTIIIDRADLLGLAQLHQIRGRVGRSHHQAYAYLFTPPRARITADARRRLDAISAHDALGAGYVLATNDLEIRGAGELLGEEQSGQITAVGFSLYMDMLNAAVKSLKQGREPSLRELTLDECDINMQIPALFPNSYIADVNTRLSLYKRLTSCENRDHFEDLRVELIDRFGFLPKESENLFLISKLKRLASALGVVKIRGDESGATIEFNNSTIVDPHYVLSLVQQSQHNEYKILRSTALRYNLPESDKNPRLVLLQKVLKALSAHTTKPTEELNIARALFA